MNCSTQGASIGCGRDQFPDSSCGLAAAVRDTLPPSEFTSTKPAISCRSDCTTAGPLALSSTSFKVYAVRIVHNDIAAALPGSGRHRHYNPITRLVVFESLLLVLTTGELVALGPTLLVLITLY